MNADLAAQHAIIHLERSGVDSRSDIERTIATVWLFEAGVSNSGFVGYFMSHRGDLAFNAPAAFARIGARELAQLATEANAVFGAAGPPRNFEARKRAVVALPETAEVIFSALERRHEICEEDADELLEQYLEHRRRLEHLRAMRT